MTSSKKHFLLFFLLLLALALIGSIVLSLATAPWGIGTNTDSANYIAGARNILAGHGYRNAASLSPITHWPPFFSFSLAAIGLLGIDPLHGARILHVILFGLNIFIVGMILKQWVYFPLLALAGAGLVITSPAMATIHSWACSEPWYIFLTFSTFFLIFRYLEKDSKALLLGAGILTGLACLDRYAGIALIAAGTITLFLFDPKPLFSRIRSSLSYFALSSFPLGLWLLRNKSLSNEAVSRTIQLHTPSPKYFFELLQTFSEWFSPKYFAPFLKHSILILIVSVPFIILFFIVRNADKKQSSKIFFSDISFRVIAVMALFMTFNAGLHLFLYMFINASVHADDRHFSPSFIAGVIIIIILLDRFLKWHSPRLSAKIVTAVFLIALGLGASANSTRILGQVHKRGYGSTTRGWHTSPTIAEVKKLPPDALIYSNNAASIYLIANRPARRLPRKFNNRVFREKESAKPHPLLLSRLKRIKERLISKNGYIVFFTRRPHWYNLTQKELEQYLPLVPVQQLEDGAIYQVAPSQSTTV